VPIIHSDAYGTSYINPLEMTYSAITAQTSTEDGQLAHGHWHISAFLAAMEIKMILVVRILHPGAHATFLSILASLLFHKKTDAVKQ
jgi:hypothetical protein